MAITRTQLATYNGTHVAYPGAMTAGDVSFCFINVLGTTTAPSGVGDNINGTYTLIGNSGSSAVQMAYLYAFFNVAAASAGACLINNLTVPSGGTGINWGAYEYGGVSSSLDGSVQTGSGSSTTPSASITTTNAADLLICVISCGSASGNTAGSGYTKQFDNATSPNLLMQDQIVAATGTYTGAMTLGSSTAWSEMQVAFKAATSGSVTPNATGVIDITGVQGALTAISPPQATGTMSISGIVSPTITGAGPGPSIISGPFPWYLIELLGR